MFRGFLDTFVIRFGENKVWWFVPYVRFDMIFPGPHAGRAITRCSAAADESPKPKKL
jgi:hypothetical protein